MISPDVGGGFGTKIFLYSEDAVVTWAARKVGRPVKWTSDRTEAFLSDAQGRDHVTTAKLALDDDGNLAVCHAGLGAVWLFSPLGEPLARVNSCAGLMTTNCAYGGPDNKTLYITESDSGQILTARLDTPGRTMFAHMD